MLRGLLCPVCGGAWLAFVFPLLCFDEVGGRGEVEGKGGRRGRGGGGEGGRTRKAATATPAPMAIADIVGWFVGLLFARELWW
jgi:hypothetical protein